VNEQEAKDYLEEKLNQLNLPRCSVVYIDETVFEDILKHKSLLSYHLIKAIELGTLKGITSAITLVQSMKLVEEDRKSLTLMYLTRIANLEYLPYGTAHLEEILSPGIDQISLEEAVHISTAALYSKKSNISNLPIFTMDPVRAELINKLINEDLKNKGNLSAVDLSHGHREEISKE
jgi:hypothetical protein